MKRSVVVVMSGVALFLAGCASVPRANGTPAYPDLPAPIVPARLQMTSDVRLHLDQGWRLLQENNLRAASREYDAALKRAPGLYPAETGLGLTALAGRQYKAAVTWFTTALGHDEKYLPAWQGLVSAETALEHFDEATKALERVLALDPSREADRTRLELLRVRQIERLMDDGRRSKDAGRLPDAAAQFTKALALSPASPTILRELALVEAASGRQSDAEKHARRAVELDANDADAHAALASVLETGGSSRAARDEYARAAAIDSKWRAKADAARDSAARTGLPDELRDVAAAATVTRAQVAAMIAVRLPALLERAQKRATPIATDIRGNWAADLIMPVLQAGVMDVQANHTFQPSATVSRSDFAQAAARLVALALTARSDDYTRWSAARPALADVPSLNVSYRAIALAVTAGVMKIDDDHRFLPARPVTGADLVAAIGRLEQLTTR